LACVSRSYRLLCPIARALDRVGDRWTLLILRDLHAGPMRFGELQRGLPGLASNLLTNRLEKLQSDGLVVREGGDYALTERGRATARLLWELATFGMGFPPDPDLKEPGHLRLAAITLENALRRVVPSGATMVAELRLDDEPFRIELRGGAVSVRYGAAEDAAVVAHSAYRPLMAAAGGELPLREFRAEHVRLEGDPDAVVAFEELLGRVMTEAFAAH
jgi:DNA-binding HxlR family transcriptional regulator